MDSSTSSVRFRPATLWCLPCSLAVCVRHHGTSRPILKDRSSSYVSWSTRCLLAPTIFCFSAGCMASTLRAVTSTGERRDGSFERRCVPRHCYLVLPCLTLSSTFLSEIVYKTSSTMEHLHPADAAPAGSVSSPSAAELSQRGSETSSQWRRSSKTRKSYDSHVRGGKEWLATWCKDSDDGDQLVLGVAHRSELANVFNTVGEKTPLALRFYTIHKCDLGKETKDKGRKVCAFGTADGIRSAFKDYFEKYLSILWALVHI